MLEMGDHAAIEHKAIVDYVETMDIVDAFFAGPYFGKLESSYNHYENIDGLTVAIGDYNLDNTLVLIKSSKGILYVHQGFREKLGI
jgi:UDP-N-acetylmuramyl pentapeptide synthase